MDSTGTRVVNARSPSPAASSNTPYPETRSGDTRSGTRERWTPYAFLAIPVLFVSVIQGYAIVRGAWLSLTDTSLLRPSNNEFVGLNNFAEIISDPDFRHVLAVTGVYILVSVGGSILLALGVALLLNRPFRGRSLARSLIAIPWAMPGVSVAFIFTWILNQQFGVLNFILQRLFVINEYQGWLNNPNQAMLAVLIPTLWQLFPLCTLVILAALQAVPRDLEDAARQDGAGDLSVFTCIVWPTIWPTVAMMTLFSTIWSIRRFELIWILTQGGPNGATNVLAIDLYRQTFEYADLGMGATYGMIGIGISLIVTIIYLSLSRRTEARA